MDLSTRVRSFLYDVAVVRLTTGWYGAVLERLPRQCRLLDVGIGTGGALLANLKLIVEKDLHVTGIDVDRDYVEHCRREVSRRGIEDRVEVRLESVYDHQGGPYEAAYFSGSFMLLPEPARALMQVCALLAPGASIYFTQTFEHRRSRAVEIAKPLLRHLTTIDFGRVTYEADFRGALADGAVEIEELRILSAGRHRSSVLVVARAPARP